MKLSVVRAFFFLLGLALISAGALPGTPRAALAEPAVRIIETSTAEPPTPTNTPIPPTATPIPPTATPTTEATPGPAPEPTLTPTSPSQPPEPGEPGQPGQPGPTATATPLPTVTPELPAEVADPAITKTVDRNTVQVGDQVTFTITVTNLGNSTASDVIVEDTLPPFLALDGVSTSRGDFSVEGSTVRVFIGDLAPQEVVTITITATAVATNMPPNNINTATVVSSSPTDDPNNNESSVEVNVVPPAPTAVPPPVSLPVTSAPGGSAAPWLIGLGMLLIVGSLLARRRI